MALVLDAAKLPVQILEQQGCCCRRRRWSTVQLNKNLSKQRLRQTAALRNGGLVVTASIGFSLDPRMKIEKAAGELLKDVATLFVYQEVFRNPPGQAFLKLLLALRRSDDGLKLLEAYGEFFKQMAFGRFPSWEDFILDGILRGEGNPFAEAAASVGNPDSHWAGEIPPSLEAAAASDLEVLQRLSIGESTLSNWVSDLVSDLRPEWRTAAASSLRDPAATKIASAGNQFDDRGFGFNDAVCGLSSLKTDEQLPEKDLPEKLHVNTKKSDVVGTERDIWRKKIGGLWKWSEAVPMLKEYHAQYGFGTLSSKQVLQCKGGKWIQNYNYMKQSPLSLSLPAQQNEIIQNLTAHVTKSSAAKHILLHGRCGIGKSALLRSAMRNLANHKLFRAIILPSNELKQLSVVLEEIRKNPSLRFVLIVNDIFRQAVEESYLLLKSALDGHVQEWPENALLCATSTKEEVTISGGSVHHLSDMFGLLISLHSVTASDG